MLEGSPPTLNKAADRSENDEEGARPRAPRQGDRGKAEDEEGARQTSWSSRSSKRVDLATTQMLNSMKAGEILPRGDHHALSTGR